jgi:hypothetical protein
MLGDHIVVNSLDNPKTKELILDILKPNIPSLPVFATFLAEYPNVRYVEVLLVEKNQTTESLEVILQGLDINYNGLSEYIIKHGAAIQSVDKVMVEHVARA